MSTAKDDETGETRAERPAGLGKPRKRHVTLPPGTPVGRYLVIAAVGRGGMGVVYEAYDPVLDRRIALKLLRTRGASETAAARLSREAQALARLNHPNVVAVHDVGELGDMLFIAMELVRGETLDRWLAARPRTIDEIVHVLAAAGRGLAAAHRAGIVHRDFKPLNVIVGEDGRVRVLDFGIARDAATPLAPDSETVEESIEDDEDSVSRLDSMEGRLSTPLTRAGTLIGTPAFMAPEQLARQPVGPRGDQFAFCVVLYRAIYGTKPFAAEQPEELLEAMKRGPLAQNKRVPARVKRVLARGLSLEPDARFADMDALLAELERDPLTRGARWAGLATAVFVVVLAVWIARRPAVSAKEPCADAAAALDALWPAKRAALERSLGDPEITRHVNAALDDHAGRWRDARVATCRATRVEETQSSTLMDLRMACLDEKLAGFAALLDLLAEPMPAGSASQAVDAALALPTLTRCSDANALTRVVPPPENLFERARVAAVREKLARVHALELAGRYADALVALEPELDGVRKLDHAPLLADVLEQHGSLLDNLGRAEEAEKVWFDATEAAARAHDAPLESVLWSMLIWEIGLKQQRFTDVPLLERAARAALARADQRPLLRAQLLGVLGAVHIYDGKYALATDYLRETLAIRERELPPGSIEIAHTLDALGMAYEVQGRLSEAIALAERALAMRQTMYGENHPGVAFPLLNLAEAYMRVGDWKKAEAPARRALDLRVKTLGEQHEDTAWAAFTLAGVDAAAGRYAEAEAGYRRVEGMLGEAAASGTMVGAMLRKARGELALARGDAPGALKYFAEARDDYVKSVGEEHPDLADVYLGLGQAQLRAGRGKDATASFERALRLAEKSGGEPRGLAETRFWLARARGRAGGEGDAKLALDLLAPLPAEPRVVKLREEIVAWRQAR